MANENTRPVDVPPGGAMGAVNTVDAYGLSPTGWRDYVVSEIDAHDKEFKDAGNRARRIVARYRDDRNDYSQQERRYNILWANTQTLLPAIVGKGAPSPVSQRRFMDADPVGRVASTIIERTLRYQFDCAEGSARAMRLAAWDWLVPGQGTVWVRYEPGTGRPPGLPRSSEGKKFGVPTKEGGPELLTSQSVESEEPAYNVERVALDYVFWEDFGFSNARVWDEVSMVWRAVYFTRDELKERFGEEIAKSLPCSMQANPTPRAGMDSPDDTPKHGVFNKAKVYEVWDKRRRTVSWISRDHGTPLDICADPLKLPGFFPCPRPMLANVTSGNLKPVPFYTQYQDQALQLDMLEQRIAMLTKACKLVGVYDASQEGVQRMLNEAVENQLIPVDTWAAFAEKGGVKGVMDWLPIEQVVSVLKTLSDLFDRLKAQVYEITGIGEIMRGASSGGTAAEARMQEQYISVRLDDLRQEYNRFMDEAVGMMGHIACTLFRDESLIAQSGILQTWDGQQTLQQAQGQMPPPPMPMPGPPGPPGMPPGQPPMPMPMGGPPGAPPPGLPPMAGAPMPPMQPPGPPPVLPQALALLRATPMSDFRVKVDIESFIDDDIAQEREQRIAFLTALTQFMQQALPAVQSNPAMGPLMNALLMFNIRTFKAGREMEGQIEQAISQLGASPPQGDKPDPKVAAEQAKAEAQVQALQAKTQADLAAKQQEGQLKLQQMQQEGQLKLQQMQQEFELRMQQMFQEAQMRQDAAAQKMQMDTMAAVAGEHREAAANEASQQRAMEQHALDTAMKVAEKESEAEDETDEKD